MSTSGKFLRVGNHVINLSRIVHIAFEIEPWTEEGAEGGGKCAFIDFGTTRDGVWWDLVLTGEDAKALEAYFGQEEEGDTLGGDTVQWE